MWLYDLNFAFSHLMLKKRVSFRRVVEWRPTYVVCAALKVRDGGDDPWCANMHG